MTRGLEGEFHQAMAATYSDAVEIGYRPTYFMQMLGEHGGLETARRLLSTPEPQAGMTKLWELGRLDLSVEALVLQERWRGLFTDAERRTARERLESYDYHPEAPQ